MSKFILALLTLSTIAIQPGAAGKRSTTINAAQNSFNVQWIHGSADCSANDDPPLQVYRFDPDTFIFRQSKCLNFEGPFMYLFIGARKAVLVDSGANPAKGKDFPIRETIQGILTEWQEAHRKSGVQLIVAHSHGHTDHTSGDTRFSGQPDTVVVKPDVDSVKAFFGLAQWPEGSSTLDLGGRVLTIIPTPGHQKAHIAIYDSKTHFLLTGDMLYPGILTVDDWPEYRKSVDRLSAFAASHKISYILGAHIEMKKTPREFYPLGNNYQPEEHVLQMTVKDLADLKKACDALGDNPVRDVHDNFIIFPRH